MKGDHESGVTCTHGQCLWKNTLDEYRDECLTPYVEYAAEALVSVSDTSDRRKFVLTIRSRPHPKTKTNF